MCQCIQCWFNLFGRTLHFFVSETRRIADCFSHRYWCGVAGYLQCCLNHWTPWLLAKLAASIMTSRCCTWGAVQHKVVCLFSSHDRIWHHWVRRPHSTVLVVARGGGLWSFLRAMPVVSSSAVFILLHLSEVCLQYGSCTTLLWRPSSMCMCAALVVSGLRWPLCWQRELCLAWTSHPSADFVVHLAQNCQYFSSNGTQLSMWKTKRRDSGRELWILTQTVYGDDAVNSWLWSEDTTWN
jgi:hypothetical protein